MKTNSSSGSERSWYGLAFEWLLIAIAIGLACTDIGLTTKQDTYCKDSINTMNTRLASLEANVTILITAIHNAST